MLFNDKYGPWALVAGASEGLGAALANGAGERGCNVVLIARTESSWPTSPPTSSEPTVFRRARCRWISAAPMRFST